VTPPNRGVAEEAHDIVHGDRRKSYGPVEESFDNIATLIRFMLPAKCPELNGKDVAIIMLCVKLVRERQAHTRDNLVDLCGYADLLQQLYDAEKVPQPA